MEYASTKHHEANATSNTRLTSQPPLRNRLLLAAVLTSLASSSPLLAAEPDGPDMLITVEDALEHQLINKIKTTIRGKTDYDRKIQTGLKAFYIKHGRKPIWLNENGLTPKAKRAIAAIKNGHRYAVNVKDIQFPSQELIKGSPEQQADAELMISRAILTYTKRSKGGNLIPHKVSRFLDNKPEYPDPLNVLNRITSSNETEKHINAFHPTHPQFWALKKKLDEIRAKAGKEKPVVKIPPGSVIRPFARHPHIALLRKRLNVYVPNNKGKPLFPENIYDSALVDAVKNFQAGNGLRPTGIINKSTRAKLNKDKPNIEKKLLANMERWRWMPTDFGRTHIHVNVPEFIVRFTKNDKVVHEERVITGKPRNKTPSFSDEMETVVFNPYWNVPQSIIWNEMGGNAPRGYESRVVNGRVFIRQPPGPRNALGRVKFLFPNKHSVYLHDTPTKNLFNRKVRAFSHGCVRVRNPLKLAEVVLADLGIDKQNIKSRVSSGRNQRVELKTKLPVHMTYFTMWSNPDGSISHFNDIYGHDKRVALALNGRPMGLEPKQRIRSDPYSVMRKKRKKKSNFITLFFN